MWRATDSFAFFVRSITWKHPKQVTDVHWNSSKRMKEDSLMIHMASAKLMGLSTDGASVMVGKTNGVAAKLRQSNGKLLNIHCVCHCLALACKDSCQELKFIEEVEEVLRQLWYYFHNSPKKTACFLKCQIELKKSVSATVRKQKSSWQKG